MFDVGWSEIAVIGVVALVAIGPKDLPVALRTVGQYVRKARKLAAEFQSSIEDMGREIELEEMRKKINAEVLAKNPAELIEKTLDPTGELSKTAASAESAAGDVRAAVVASPSDPEPDGPPAPPMPMAQAPQAEVETGKKNV